MPSGPWSHPNSAAIIPGIPLPLKTSSHRETPRRLTNVSGTRYFHAIRINWSTRSRGNVQRTHIMISTIVNAFVRNTPRENRFPQIHGSVPALKNGTFHPCLLYTSDAADDLL